MTKAEYIYKTLIKRGIINATGSIKMSMLGVSFNLSEKSALGDIIQEWLKNWLKSENIYFRLNQNTQEPPDFYLSDSDELDLLEIKVFDYTKAPNFDVANFDTYLRAILRSPNKIDSDYLIFGYDLKDSYLIIKQIWLKKVWEICRGSERFPINTQCKQNKIYNIRPGKWYSSDSRFPIFNTRREFIEALDKTIKIYDDLSPVIDKKTWLKEVQKKYKELTKNELF